MTAINCLVGQNSAWILTDGMHTNPDGSYGLMGPKVLLLPHLHCAIAARGPTMLLSAVGITFCQNFSAFEDMTANAGEVLEAVLSSAKDILLGQNTCDLFIAGWSSIRKTMEAYVTFSYEQNGSAARPYTIQPIAVGSITPYVDITDLDLQNNPSLLVEVGKRQRDQVRHSGGQRGIGGFLQITEITSTGCSTYIAHSWPEDREV